jgi:hypothetical protein
LCARRWILYVAAATIILAAELALAFYSRLPHSDIVAGFLLGPILTAITNVHVANDLHAASMTARQRWERILERLWAVIVIDFIAVLVMTVGTYAMAFAGVDLIGGLILGAFAFMIAAAIVYADVYASLEPEVSTLTVVPRAFLRSIVLGMLDFRRALALLAIQVLISTALQALALFLDAKHVAHSQIWGGLPLGTFLIVPLSALTTVIYLDLAARERQTARK